MDPTVTAKQNTPKGPDGEVLIGDPEFDGRVILYVIKADETSYINYVKPLILAQELQLPHCLAVIDTHSEWAYQMHPERYVPALRDQDPETGERINVFEGTACLYYLAGRFDHTGDWLGRTAYERGAVHSWTAYQTAGIGLHENTVKQWDILESRLALPDQKYIALRDRPTIADLSYFPFAMPWMFKFLSVDMQKYPHIVDWADRMLARSAVQKVMESAPRIGH
ncbi:hypothetical protein NQ176_g9298 [Zarea fungicola]|uniref:Uncharacterized protein n=1 Tax=Zarea fungicola TaxID=93591 RepID=A0ACC1MMH4_9HYPO|nr:hypothetical protein NQ176_g9298 [Lecanicillium fungicola]